jgi:lipopolysaccharide export system protein LptA
MTRLTSFVLAALSTAWLLAAPAHSAQTVDTTAAAQESKTPRNVDIEADQMEVLDDQNRAIFTGNVNAKRGSVTMKCAKLVVDFKDTVQADGTKGTEVTNLDATGGVNIVTSNQTVTGEWAKMDVKANQLNVGGDVKVVQGKTILNGQQLFVDLNTNRSEMKGGRVRGSFIPGQ